MDEPVAGTKPNLSNEADNKYVEAAIQAAAVAVTYEVRDFRPWELPGTAER